jgi:hypothetical protein
VNITRGGIPGPQNFGVGGQGGFGANEATGATTQFSRPGGPGGSGVVIIRYPRNFPPLEVSAGLVFYVGYYTDYTVYTFTAGSGVVTF